MVNNKKILITGGAGFIGANFVYKFLELGNEVNVVEKEGASPWRLEKVKDKINLHLVNLTEYDRIKALITEIEPDIILHFAAYGVYQAKQQDIRKTIDANLLATVNLVRACNEIKFECFINTGSNSEYGIKDKPMKENDLLEPDNLYGVAKAASTLYCRFMAKKMGLPIAITRLFAPYGYFEEKDRLIPTVIKSFLENEELNLSCPGSVRDFIFVEDIIGAYFAIIENIQKVKGEIFNVGTGVQTTIGELVDTAKEITRSPVKPNYGQVKPAQTEPKTWLADVSKAKKLLNWQPKYNLRQGLEKDVKWFRENINLYK